VVYALSWLLLIACEKPTMGPDLDEARPLSDLPGRDPEGEELDWLAETYLSLAAARGTDSAPPLVRVVTTEEHRELVARQQAAAPRLLEEQALKAIGLLGTDDKLAELTVVAAPPAVWLPDKRVLTVLEPALGTLELEHALALSLDGTCTPATASRDARLAALAAHQGIATATWLADMLAEREVSLSDAAIDGQVATGVLSERAAWISGHPLVAAEQAWARTQGTLVALRLHQAGAFRSLDSLCKDPPAATHAFERPEEWSARGRPPLAGPAVPAWESAGWRRLGEDRMGSFTLGWWLTQIGGDPELAESWVSDALTVYRGDGTLQAAWSVQLSDLQDAHLLRSLLDGRTLRDGRTLHVELAGQTVTVLTAAGEPVLQTGENPGGGG